MSEIVRDPNRLFLCPRCGRPVTYKGRGRRPVWCSARCRVEASIERRGNRVVGVEPRVLTIIPPKKRLSQWESDRRREIGQSLTEDVVVAMVAREPHLLVKVLERVEGEGSSGSEATRQVVAEALIRTARAVAPADVEPLVAHRRDGSEWAQLLTELSTQLANGRLYNRDLPALDQPLAGVVERYLRRQGG